MSVFRNSWQGFSFTVVTLMAAAAALADGDLDSQFGNAGRVMLERPGVQRTAEAALGSSAVLANGKTVWVMEDGLGATRIGRLNRDGSADTGFGNNGQVLLSTCAKRRPMRILAVEDALLVWAGACLVKLDNTGAADPAFGAGATHPPTATSLQFRAAALSHDSLGRILLAGTSAGEWQVWRYLADGSNDLDFGNSGVASVAAGMGTQQSEATAMALRGGDRIVLVGIRNANFLQRLRLAQLTQAGQPDRSFGDQGISELLPPANFQGLQPLALAINGDGSILVAGNGQRGVSSCCVMVARFSELGALLPKSMQLFSLGNNVSLNAFGESTSAVTLLPDGKILLARNTFPPSQPGDISNTRFTLIRLLANGALDLSFSAVGWRSYQFIDPSGSGARGAYSQLHAVAFTRSEVLMMGRTFFEDGGPDLSYTSLLRVRFDAVFSDGFE